MAELVIYRGLPGSGKTTLAKAWVADAPTARARVNRDDIRAMLHDGLFLGHDTESHVVATRDRTIRGLLKDGISVASDDTNLPNDVCRQLARIAAAVGVTVVYQDLTDVSVDMCVFRDDARRLDGGRSVGADVIRAMHEKFIKGRPYPLPVPERAAESTAVEPYVPDLDLPPAWLVDVDGTLAHMSGRGPFEWARVGEDACNDPVRELVVGLDKAVGLAGFIVVLSGRDEVCRPQTEAWLHEHEIPYDELLMRRAGDMRKDATVKLEIFREQIAPRFNVRGVVDDRVQVVEMWRALGLVCAQVAPGDF